METFNTIVNSVLLNLGGSLLITIVLFILGLCFGAGFKKSFRGGLYAGFGLTCLNMMTGFLTTAMGPTVQGLSEMLGRTSQIQDVGWGVAGLAFAWPGAAFTIIAVMLVNVILIIIKAAKTMWTDIWSFWHGQVVGCFVWAMTGNLFLGILAATIFLTIGTFLGDATCKEYQEYNKMPGISISCCYAVFGLIAKPFNWIFDRIPGFNKIDVSPDTIREKVGVFGDQGVMGAIIGFIIGVVVWIGGKGSIFAALNLAVNVGVFMVFLPKAIGVLCEGVIPIANAVVNLVHEKFSGKRDIWVAIDCGALMGSPAVLASAVILYPLVVLISVFLPGNMLLPIASLAVIPAQCGAVAPFFKGNILRMVVFVLLLNIPLLYLASSMAPVQTAAMAAMQMGDPNVLNSSLDMGGDPLGFVIVNAFKLLTGK